MTVPELAVLLHGQPIATLQRTPGGALRLRYAGDAALSLSLPTDQTTHTGATVETWLRGLLPENDYALAAVERRFGASRHDPMSLLDAIGKDCAGAVQFCRPAEVEEILNRGGELIPAPDYDIEQRLGMMAIDKSASWTMPNERWSLGGTQQKFTLRRKDGQWFYATGSEPTTHIVKPGVRDLAAQALVEHLSMSAASRLGLPAAPTEYRSFGTEDAIVIARFDRVVEGDRVRRLHQEDMCQAMGVGEKYEELGGPTARQIVEALREHSATAEQAQGNVDRFVDGLIVNTVIGAPDAHGRNFAVILEGAGPELAPLYDVASGLGHQMPNGRRRTMSMSIGGTSYLDEVDAEAWMRFAGECELDDQEVLDRVGHLAEGAVPAFEAALGECAGFDGGAELRARLMPQLRELAGSMAGQAAGPGTGQLSAPEPVGDRFWRQGHSRGGRTVAGHWVKRQRG